MEGSYCRIVKTKALISCAVTVQLICVFVFAYAKSWFSHDTAQIISVLLNLEPLGIVGFICNSMVAMAIAFSFKGQNTY